MTRAEMTLKVVMSPSEPVNAFVDQFNKLLTDADSSEFDRVLEMKGLSKMDKTVYKEHFNSLQPVTESLKQTSLGLMSSPSASGNSGSNGNGKGTVEEEESKIKKLEKMIRKKL